MSVPGIATLLLLAVVAAPQQEVPATPEEIVERIVELQREIESLLQQLPPDLQEEVRRRLAAQSTAGEASSAEAPKERSATATQPTAPVAEVPGGTDEPETTGAAPPAVSGASPPTTATPPSHQSPFGPASPAHPPAETPSVEVTTESPPPRCNTLLAFDEDGDGSVTAADRLWRHLYLWTDANGDDLLTEREVRHLYDHGVRAVDINLHHYTDKRGLSGDIRVQQGVIRFELLSSHRHSEEATLVADATGLAQSGELELLSPAGAPLEGYQPLAPGLELRGPNGTITLTCP